ncbi:coiled-coil domain-containing protein 114 isoform X2 [Stegostoma tigrinum]|uniref:coiled-coil domain-containing protein 114 isoform X2 n=1 Tax=Stegostoma tigrinum TaxID=3053191 RepID=UPI00202B8F55|nr:coiled-coil domain-containing protein 114 isoform X2 [Stegostoma tigrinum]
MPRGSASSNRSNASDGDMEGLAETELAKLQHQFRIMEGDRQAYTLESQQLLRKQLVEIENLEKDREELMLNLRLLGSKRNQKEDRENMESVQNMLSYQEELEDQIAREKQMITDLEHEIKMLKQKIFEQKKDLSKGANVQVMNEQVVKNIGIMEDRVDRELLEIRKEIGSAIDSSTAAYEARDEAQTKMQQVKEKAEKDLALHAAEMKELQRVIDHDRKLKEFMGIKTQERLSEDMALHGMHKQERGDSARKKKDTGEETVEMYEAAFQQIRALTGEDNLNMVVAKFKEVEDRNFALFNYINEQNSEIEKLQEEIADIQAQIEAFKLQEQQREQEHKVILKKIEIQQEEASKQAAERDNRIKGVRKILDQLKEKIDSLFTRMNCDRSILDEMLGSSSGIRDNNVMQYLGLIEQRANELLSIQSYLASKDYNKPYDPREAAIFLMGQNLKKPPPPVYIEPPSTGNDNDSDVESPVTDEEERPLTQNELRQRILKGVMRKEAKALKRSSHYDRSQQKF